MIAGSVQITITREEVAWSLVVKEDSKMVVTDKKC
ncbi:hypothetical protein MFFC18_31420 [Mariniblastus fucicola]|uniref:Uncharacterized protein n=1 Tax=Mariniblastus fucicola TaxID=980251 RepID=A0A5B9PF47_9BACT|nr:hypothetical protein MFFC18_31420 [Mariniblastus fucicola]